MQAKRLRRLAFVLVAIVVAGGAASRSGVVRKLDGALRTEEYGVTFEFGRPTEIVARRGPLNLGDRTFPVVITGSFGQVGFLDEMVLYEGRDRDGDGTIQAAEWRTVQKALVRESGRTEARIDTTVSAKADVWRLVVRCRDVRENYYEQVGGKGLVIRDP